MSFAIKKPPFRVCAVNYFNTIPLVWGMLYGEQRSEVDLTFAVPAECAAAVERGDALVGLVPVAEVVRQNLEIVAGVGIACDGPVRSILLVSKVPWQRITTLAVDASSRTSVVLARIILRERYGAEPDLVPLAPSLTEMMQRADAALIIGDPALALDPASLPYAVLDLGAAWQTLTNLPMVFAVWAGKPPLPADWLQPLLEGSYQFGSSRLDDMIASESVKRNVTPELARSYLTTHIQYKIGPLQQKGLTAFLTLSSRFGYLPAASPGSLFALPSLTK